MSFLDEMKARIELIDNALADALEFECQPHLLEAMRHLPLAGGKRLRPLLAMLAAEALGEEGERTIPYGVALELIHNFTLVHDDIMDNDELRRNVKTVHTLYGDATAINAGDVLFARAFEVLGELDIDPGALVGLFREVATTVREIGEGQQSDIDFEQRLDVDEDEYLEMIRQKTARIFEAAARGGAIIAGGTPEQVETLAALGRIIGVGFQVWDDYLDLTANETQLGKPVGSDIRDGKKTIIVVHALARLGDADRKALLDVLGNRTAPTKKLERAMELLKECGSIAYAGSIAEKYADEARRLLEQLPEHPSREAIRRFFDFMVRRIY